uniref:Uncharacterized protein n=1 Tax=Ditylenchus dipsaci TaxID=166011 RepID=A0A915CZ52_9BILA
MMLNVVLNTRRKKIINSLLDLDERLINSTSDSPNYSPLEIAVLAGRLTLVRELLKEGDDLKVKDVNGDTALHLAAEAGEIEITKELLKHLEIVDLRNNNNLTALHFAADNNQKAIVKLLLEAGADVNAKGNDLSNPTANTAVITPLHFAVIKGYADVAKILIDSEADVNALGPQNTTPLLYAISGNHTELSILLLKSGANPYAAITISMDPALTYERDWQNLTPLHIAILENQEQIAVELIDAGADVNATIRYGNTPLEVAPMGSEKLLENRVSVEAKDDKNRTPLHLAAQNGNIEIVDALLGAGSDVNSTANYPDDAPEIPAKVTPLHLAASKSHLEAKDARYLTALHVAARDHHKDIVKYLLEQGANVNGKMNYLNDLPGAPPRATALDFADCLDKDIVQELKKHGAKETDFYFSQEKSLVVLGVGFLFFIVLVIGLVKYRFNCFK